MSTAAFDSVLDDSGLFRAIRGERVQRESRLVRLLRQRVEPHERNWVWAIVAVLLAVALLDAWNTLSSRPAPEPETAIMREL